MDLKRLLPYLKYLPVIIAVVSAMADVVESSSGDHTSSEKEKAALEAARAALTLGGINVPDDVVIFAIRGVVAVKNSLGVYISKKQQG